MKKIITPIVIATFTLVVACILLLKSFPADADVQPKINCNGQVNGINYICTDESNERCTFVDGGLNGQTSCYGTFYQRP